MPDMKLVGMVMTVALLVVGCSPNVSDDCTPLPDTSYKGSVNNTTFGVKASTDVTLKQSECKLTGIMLINKPLIGGGPISGSMAKDKVYFKIDKRDSDAGVDIVFTGTISESGLKGTYQIPERAESGEWELTSETRLRKLVGENPAAALTWTPTSLPTPAFRTYVHPQGLWQITYPSTWIIKGPQGSPANSSVEKVTFTSMSGAFAVLDVERYVSLGRAYGDSSSWCRGQLSNIVDTTNANRKSVRLISDERTVVGSQPGCEYTYYWEGGTIKFMQISVSFVVGADAYELDGATSEENWSVFKAALTQSIYAFKLLR